MSPGLTAAVFLGAVVAFIVGLVVGVLLGFGASATDRDWT